MDLCSTDDRTEVLRVHRSLVFTPHKIGRLAGEGGEGGRNQRLHDSVRVERPDE